MRKTYKTSLATLFLETSNQISIPSLGIEVCISEKGYKGNNSSPSQLAKPNHAIKRTENASDKI